MRLAIRHTTRYAFDDVVGYGLQRLRLSPKSTHGQQVEQWDMDLTGALLEVSYDDHHQNHVSLVSLEPGVGEISISCSGIVKTQDNAGVVGAHSGPMPLWSFGTQTSFTQPGPKMRALVGALEREKLGSIEKLHRLSALILDTVRYDLGRTTTSTTAEDAMTGGYGVCQDHAHIFIGCARLMAIPARYVSGYLMMEGKVEQDAGHAWAEAMVDGLGWVGFDVSNQICPDARYIRVASGRDYREAAPVTGISFGPASSALHVAVQVEQQGGDQ